MHPKEDSIMNNTTQCSSNIVMHIVLVKYEFHTEKKLSKIDTRKVTYFDENTFEQLMCSLMSQRALYSLLCSFDIST